MFELLGGVMDIQMSDKVEDEMSYVYGAVFALANRLQNLGDTYQGDITTKQWFLLAVASKFETAPTIGQLAAVTGTSRQNVKKMAVILEKEGFLSIKRDENDARILRIILTDKCRERSERSAQRDILYLQEVFADISQDMLKGMYEGFKQLERNIIRMEEKYEKTED